MFACVLVDHMAVDVGFHSSVICRIHADGAQQPQYDKYGCSDCFHLIFNFFDSAQRKPAGFCRRQFLNMSGDMTRPGTAVAGQFFRVSPTGYLSG